MKEKLEQILAKYDQTELTTYEEDLDACSIGIEYFSEAIQNQCAEGFSKGWGGWHRPIECSLERLVSLYNRAVEQGNVVKVGVYAMMLHGRGVVNTQEDLIKAELSELSDRIHNLTAAQETIRLLQQDCNAIQQPHIYDALFETSMLIERQIKEADTKRLANLKALGEL